MRTQWTTKGNRDAGSSCSCDRGLRRYLRNFGGGVWAPQTTPSVRHWVRLRPTLPHIEINHWLFFYIFIVAPCILVPSKSFIYQQIHFISILENNEIYINNYIKISPTCFGLRPSSGSPHMSLAKVTYFYRFNKYDLGSWGGVVVKALRYYSGGPGINSRWCHWGFFFPWYPRQNHVPWGRLSLWKWVPGISAGVKAAGAFRWRPTTLVVPKRERNGCVRLM